MVSVERCLNNVRGRWGKLVVLGWRLGSGLEFELGSRFGADEYFDC